MKSSTLETTALAPGTVVRHVTVVECLGLDQQDCIYRAESTDTEHPMLLAEYLPAGLVVRTSHGVQTLPGKAEALKRATAAYANRLREAALVGHPALPVLDDFWKEQGTMYSVGPWQPGRSLLLDLSTRKAPIDADLLALHARALCDALAALHRHNLVHGNLSPHMLRVLDTGELMLPLVGGAVFTEDAPPWMAPEQHPLNPKSGSLGPWTDIYQLSAVMHQLMTGHPPPAVIRRWEGATLERLSDMSAMLPPGLVVATRKGLSMHPSARPQTIAAWLELAGLPDRREHVRHSPQSDTLTTAALDEAKRSSGSRKRMRIPAPTGGYVNAFSPSPDGTFDTEDASPQSGTTTPTWVWMCVVVALGALLSIVIRSQ